MVTPALDLEGIERRTYVSNRKDGVADIDVKLCILECRYGMPVEAGFAVVHDFDTSELFQGGVVARQVSTKSHCFK